MADLSVQELFVQMHANIDEIHQTVQSLNDIKGHGDEMDRLELEREQKINEMKKQHEDAAQELVEMHEKEGKELEEKRRVEYEELMQRRIREDEERIARIQKEEEDRERVKNAKDEARSAEHEDKKLSLHNTIEKQLERMEDEMERKVEEGKNKLAGLEKRRRDINAQIEAALDKPTVIPTITYRSRARTSPRQAMQFPSTTTASTKCSVPSEVNGNGITPDVGTRSLDVLAGNEVTNGCTREKSEGQSKPEIPLVEKVEGLNVESTEDAEEPKQDHPERVPAAIKTQNLESKSLGTSSPFPPDWEPKSLDGPEDEVFVANAERILKEHSRLRSISSLGSSSGYGGGRDSPVTERKPVLELVDDGASEVSDQETPEFFSEQSKDTSQPANKTIDSKYILDEGVESKSEFFEGLKRDETEGGQSDFDNGQVTQVDKGIDFGLTGEISSHIGAAEANGPRPEKNLPSHNVEELIVKENFPSSNGNAPTSEDAQESPVLEQDADGSENQPENPTRSLDLEEHPNQDNIGQDTSESRIEHAQSQKGESIIIVRDHEAIKNGIDDEPTIIAKYIDLDDSASHIDDDAHTEEPGTAFAASKFSRDVHHEPAMGNNELEIFAESLSLEEPWKETMENVDQRRESPKAPSTSEEEHELVSKPLDLEAPNDVPDDFPVTPEARHDLLAEESVVDIGSGGVFESAIYEKAKNIEDSPIAYAHVESEVASIDDETAADLEPRILDGTAALEDGVKLEEFSPRASTTDEELRVDNETATEDAEVEKHLQILEDFPLQEEVEAPNSVAIRPEAAAQRAHGEDTADEMRDFEPRNLDESLAGNKTESHFEPLPNIPVIASEKVKTNDEPLTHEKDLHFEPRNVDGIDGLPLHKHPEVNGEISLEISTATEERPSTPEESVADSEAGDLDEFVIYKKARIQQELSHEASSVLGDKQEGMENSSGLKLEKSLSELTLQNFDEYSDHEEEKTLCLAEHTSDITEEHTIAQNSPEVHKEEYGVEVDPLHANEDHSRKATQEHEEGDNSNCLAEKEMREDFQPRNLDEARDQDEVRDLHQQSHEVYPIEHVITAHLQEIVEDPFVITPLSTDEYSRDSNEVVAHGEIHESLGNPHENKVDKRPSVFEASTTGERELNEVVSNDEIRESVDSPHKEVAPERESEDGKCGGITPELGVEKDITEMMAADPEENNVIPTDFRNLDFEQSASPEEILFLDIAELDVPAPKEEEALPKHGDSQPRGGPEFGEEEYSANEMSPNDDAVVESQDDIDDETRTEETQIPEEPLADPIILEGRVADKEVPDGGSAPKEAELEARDFNFPYLITHESGHLDESHEDKETDESHIHAKENSTLPNQELSQAGAVLRGCEQIDQTAKEEVEETWALVTKRDEHFISGVEDNSTLSTLTSEEATSDAKIATLTEDALRDITEPDTENEELSANRRDEDVSFAKETQHREESPMESPVEIDTEAWLKKTTEVTKSFEDIDAENFAQEHDETQVEVAQVDGDQVVEAEALEDRNMNHERLSTPEAKAEFNKEVAGVVQSRSVTEKETTQKDEHPNPLGDSVRSPVDADTTDACRVLEFQDNKPSNDAELEKPLATVSMDTLVHAQEINENELPQEVEVIAASPLNALDKDEDTRSEADSEASSVQVEIKDASVAELLDPAESWKELSENGAATSSESIKLHTSSVPDAEEETESLPNEPARQAFSPTREILFLEPSTPMGQVGQAMDYHDDSPMAVINTDMAYDGDAGIDDEGNPGRQPRVTVQDQRVSEPRIESIISDSAHNWDKNQHVPSIMEEEVEEPLESPSAAEHLQTPPNIFANLVNTIRPEIQLVRQMSEIPVSPEDYYSHARLPSQEESIDEYLSDGEDIDHQHAGSYLDLHEMNEAVRYRSDTVGTAPGFDSYAPSDDADTSPGTPIHEIVDNAQEALMNEHLISLSWPVRNTNSLQEEDDHHLKAAASPRQEEFDPYNPTEYGSYITPKTSNLNLAANEDSESVFRMSADSHDSSPVVNRTSHNPEFQVPLHKQDYIPTTPPRSPPRSVGRANTEYDNQSLCDPPAPITTSQEPIFSTPAPRSLRRPSLLSTGANSSSPSSIFQRTRSLFESSSNGTPLLPSLGTLFSKPPRSPKGASPARIRTERPSSMYHVDPFPTNTPPKRSLSSSSQNHRQQEHEKVIVPRSLDGSGRPPSPGFALPSVSPQQGTITVPPLNQSRPTSIHKAGSSVSNSEDGGFYTPNEQNGSFMGKKGVEENIQTPNNTGRSEKAPLLREKYDDDDEDDDDGYTH